MKPKILVVGSFVMDQIVTAPVFPRAGQTVIGEKFQKAPGGKGANQAVQMARLGAEVHMCGMLGDDANGDELRAACREAGVDVSDVMTCEGEASGCSVILLERKSDGQTENRILVVPGANLCLGEENIFFLKSEIKNYDLLVLQLEIPMQTNIQLAQYARDANVPVMLNSAPSAELPEVLLRNLTYICPNEHEARDLTGITISHTADEIDLAAAAAAARVLQSKGVENVLITLGNAGAVFTDGTSLIHSPAVKQVRAVDPTAAGDSFVGAFCVALCRKMPIQDCLRFANHAAALTVTKMGAQPSLPKLSEVEEFMK